MRRHAGSVRALCLLSFVALSLFIPATEGLAQADWALGVSIAQNAHRLIKTSSFNAAHTNTGTDVELEVCARWERLEVRAGVALTERFGAAADETGDARIEERFWTFPFTVALAQRYETGAGDVIISGGAGASLSVLNDQIVSTPTSRYEGDFGDYTKAAWFVDARGQLRFSKRDGAFVGFRLQYDFHESDNADGATVRYATSGIYLGLSRDL